MGIEHDDRYILKNINTQNEDIVESNEYIWLVKKGTVLVYLTEVNEEDVPQRRFFLSDFNAGEAFLTDTADIEGLRLKCLLSSETDTEILGIKLPEFLSKKASNLKEYLFLLKGMVNFFVKLNSLHHLGIVLTQKKDDVTAGEISALNKAFYDSLAQNIIRLKETEQDEITGRRALFNRSRMSSLKSISQFLSGKIKNSLFDEARTQNPVYDTCQIICKSLGIRIAKYSSVKECLNEDMDLEGISRVSKFPVREISLEGDWWKKDIGHVFSFHSDDNRPIALIPSAPGKYMAYDTEKKLSCKVDREYAAKLMSKAYTVYKPFPGKELGRKEILSFIFSSLGKRDFVFLAVFTFVGTVIGLIIPLFEQALFDNYVPEGDEIGLVQIGLLFLSIIAGGFFIGICKDLSTYRLGIKIKFSIESAIYDRLFNLPSTFFNGYNSSELTKRVINITGMLESFSGIIITAVVTGIFSLIYFIQMMSYSFKLAVVGMLLIALNIGVKLINRKLLLENAQKYNSSSNKVLILQINCLQI